MIPLLRAAPPMLPISESLNLLPLLIALDAYQSRPNQKLPVQINICRLCLQINLEKSITFVV